VKSASLNKGVQWRVWRGALCLIGCERATQAQLPMTVSKTFGVYRVLKTLETSADYQLYLARHTQTGERVWLAAAPEADRAAQERFLARLQLTRRLKHPHIHTFYTGGKTPQGAYYAVSALMPTLRAQGRASNAALLVLSAQLCAALDYAHAQGVAHGKLSAAAVVRLPTGAVALRAFELTCQPITTEAQRADLSALAALLGAIAPSQPARAALRAAARNRFKRAADLHADLEAALNAPPPIARRLTVIIGTLLVIALLSVLSHALFAASARWRSADGDRFCLAADCYADSDGDRDHYIKRDGDCHAHAHANAERDRDRHAERDGDCHAHVHADAERDRDHHAKRDCHCHADAHAERTATATPTPIPRLLLETQPCVALVGDSVTHGGVTYEVPRHGYIVGLTDPLNVYLNQRLAAIGRADLTALDRGASHTGISSGNHPSYFRTTQYAQLLADNCRYTLIMPWLNDISPELPIEQAAQRHVRALAALIADIRNANPYGYIVVLDYYQGATSPFAARTWAYGFTAQNVQIFNKAIAQACEEGALSDLPLVSCAPISPAFEGLGIAHVIGLTTREAFERSLISPLRAEARAWLNSFYEEEPNGLLLGDGVHLSIAGKDALARYLAELIQALPDPVTAERSLRTATAQP
jgi:lysophospholipase L1-like esterase